MLVYLNGQYLPLEEARISVDDRGFLFADGIYEVVRVYAGKPFLLAEHLERLRAGLAALRLDPRAAGGLEEIAQRLLAENGLGQAEATLYIQVTRGAAPRKHSFPEPETLPTVYVAAKPFAGHPEHFFREGVAAVTVPDTRWARCDIKSIALLPNVLANQTAREQGAFEAIFVKDGVALEGSHSNLLAVLDGVLVTYPRCNYILPGITRDRVLALARVLGIPVREGPIFLDALFAAEEVFLSGTTTEVLPIATVDGRPIGEGRPGPIARRLQEAYRDQT